MSATWRTTERFPISIRTKLQLCSTDRRPIGPGVQALALDVSDGGMRFQFRRDASLVKDAFVRLTLEEPGIELVDAVVLKVAWVRRSDDDNVAEALGAFFVDVTERDRQTLIRLGQRVPQPAPREASPLSLVISVGVALALLVVNLAALASIHARLDAADRRLETMFGLLDRLESETAGTAQVGEQVKASELSLKAIEARLAAFEKRPLPGPAVAAVVAPEAPSLAANRRFEPVPFKVGIRPPGIEVTGFIASPLGFKAVVSNTTAASHELTLNVDYVCSARGERCLCESAPTSLKARTALEIVCLTPIVGKIGPELGALVDLK